MPWVEVILTYAIITTCYPNGRCDQGSRQVPIRADVVGTFPTMQACSAEAIKDIQLLHKDKKLAKYKPGPLLGNYQTFMRPVCYPISAGDGSPPVRDWPGYLPPEERQIKIPYR